MIYFYDGSKEAFLTAFLIAFSDDDAVLTSGNKQIGLGQQTVFVRADKARARRAEERFLQLDKKSMHDLDTLLRSGAENKDTVAYQYMKMIAARGMPVREMLAEDAICAAAECMRRVGFACSGSSALSRARAARCTRPSPRTTISAISSCPTSVRVCRNIPSSSTM